MINCQIHLALFIYLKIIYQTTVPAYNEQKKVWNSIADLGKIMVSQYENGL